MGKPIVLHTGEPIKYNHDFYNKDFLSRFDVVQNEDLDRESFIQALKNKKYVSQYIDPTLLTDRIGMATSLPSSVLTSKLAVKWGNGTTDSFLYCLPRFEYSRLRVRASIGPTWTRWGSEAFGTPMEQEHPTKQSRIQAYG
jgi:hypothetical protein